MKYLFMSEIAKVFEVDGGSIEERKWGFIEYVLYFFFLKLFGFSTTNFLVLLGYSLFNFCIL